MGRSKNNKRKQHPQQQKQAGKSKRQRKQRFWILDCRDTSKSRNQNDEEENIADVEILVTRVELLDDYKQVPRPDQSKTMAGEADVGEGTAVEGVPDDTARQEASLSSRFEDHKAPILSLMSPVVQSSSLIDLEDQKGEDEKNSPPIKDETNSSSIKDETNSSSIKDENDSSSIKDEQISSSIKDEQISSSIKVAIRKASSAKGPMPKCAHYVDDFRNLPNGDCGDGVVNPYPKDEVPDKYWSQRRRLFSLFDEGIQLDKESWYSVTPEAIANHIACHFVGSTQDAIVLDLFCGCGGNAIAFAAQKNVKLVVCIDKDLQKLKKAHWNASIYGVQDKLLLVHADAGNVLSRYCGGKIVTSPKKDEDQSERLASLPEAIDAIFLSPPWGGIDYGNVGRHGYDLTCIKIAAEDGTPCDGEWLLEQATKALGHKGIAFFLPKNINGVALAKSAHTAGCRNTIVMEQNVLNGKLKTVTAYLGLGS